ncbi:hypothetical protein IL306_012765 [Fusarium sp. DS 682]|nr:hypothetical protein IL306_012765 [Fusarium sp. DS 682]
MSERRESSFPPPDYASRTVSGVLVRRDSSKSTYSSNTQTTTIDLKTINNSISNIRAAVNAQYTMPPTNPSTTTNDQPSGHHHNQSSTNYSQSATYNYKLDGNTGPQWINAFAGPGCRQENRQTYDINAKFSKELVKNPPIRCVHNTPIKIGKGDQINMNLVQCDGDPEGFVVPNMDGQVWINPSVIPCSSAHEEDSIPRQFNGIEIKMKQKEEEQT